MKKNKKVMNDTIEQTANLLILALKNSKGKGKIISKSAMMFEDYNYQEFNSTVLTGSKDDLGEEEIKLTFKDTNVDATLDIEKELLEGLTKKGSLDKDEIGKIINAQEKDELLDLSQLKTAVNSEISGTVKVIYYSK